MRRFWERSEVYSEVALMVFVCAFPLIWMLSTWLKPSTEILAWPPYLVPHQPTLRNLYRLFFDTNFLIYFKNSMICAWVATALSVAVGSMGRYNLTRYRYPGREQIALGTLLTYIFPPIVLIVPFFMVFRKFGLAESCMGLILAYTALSLTFSTWMLRAFFQSIPLALEEAASWMERIACGQSCMSWSLWRCLGSLLFPSSPSLWPGMIVYSPEC